MESVYQLKDKRIMLSIPGNKLWLYHKAVDLRKSYYSLQRVIEKELSRDACSGEGFIFINRNKTLAKVLWWDRTGWCLLAKKLSRGRYRVGDDMNLRELNQEKLIRFFDGL